MRVLWFTDTPSLYKKSQAKYNGSGWIESLQKIIGSEKNIDLGICFFHTDDCFKSKEDNTTYYPIPLYNSTIRKLKHQLFYSKYDSIEVEAYLKVIDDFKPDLIHVFGSEKSYGLITYHTTIPVVIHIQGILNPYMNAYFAPGNNTFDFVKQYLVNPFKLINSYKIHRFFSHNAKREEKILSNCKYFIGRTDWDKGVNLLFSPGARYFYGSEVLRSEFYNEFIWQKQQNRGVVKIVSTISKVPYKGFDLILKTAKLLKEKTNLQFEWLVFGVEEYSYWETKTGIAAESVNVSLKGNANAKLLVENLKDADMYVHPSYIDNSPNSVCEAQILGVPVISTFVGGVPTLIENNITGMLVPANDPYYLAAKIVELSRDEAGVCANISTNARQIALKRHNREEIFSGLLAIYNEIIKDSRL